MDAATKAFVETYNQGIDHAIKIIETYEKMPLTVARSSKEELLGRIKNSIRQLQTHAQ